MAGKDSMTVESKRKRVAAESPRSSGSSPHKEPYHFYAILTPEVITSGKLMIPDKFMAEIGEQLASVVVLRVLSLPGFDVVLERGPGGAYLCQGFEEFIKQFGIEERNVLVFGSTGESRLSVIIHRNRSEVSYPPVNGFSINKDTDEANVVSLTNQAGSCK